MRQLHTSAARHRKPPAAEPAPGRVERSPDMDEPQPDVPQAAVQAMVAAIEADILASIETVSQTIGTASAAVSAAGSDLARLDVGLKDVASTARGAASRTFRIANSAEELAATSDGMMGAIDVATQKTRDAVTCARGAHGMMADLAKTAEEIAGIVDMVAAVARQTNLLALTATIEAARAGAAGTSFATIAGDVKTLSEETSKAARDIRGRIARLRQSAGSSIRSVEQVVSVIQDVQPALATVRGAVHGQNASLTAVAQQATEVSVSIIGLSQDAEQIQARAHDAARRVTDAGEGGARAQDVAHSLGQGLVTVLRQNEAVDRRQHDRYPAHLNTTLHVGAHPLATHTIDIGAGGVLLANLHAVALSPGYPIHMDIEGLGRLSARVAGVSAAGLHCAFADLDREAGTRLGHVLSEIEEEYRPLVAVAKQAARRVEALLEQAVAEERLTLEQLFDTAYRPIPGTEPRQYECAFTQVLEDLLPEIQEPLLLSDNRMSFCVAVDRNGYAPVHNRKYACPQRPGDIAWNTANSRNKRIFNDRAGLIAARSSRPFVIQSSARDMGAGRTVAIREVDAPLRVRGRHWGGFRTGYQF